MGDDVDGVIINSGSFGYIINLALLGLISRKIEEYEKTTGKKYD